MADILQKRRSTVDAMDNLSILLVHGGTQRLERLTKLIEHFGFEVIVSGIPTRREAKHDAVVFAGGLVPAGSYREVKMWSKHFIQDLDVPFLGICLGHLMLGLAYGSTYRTLPMAEYGSAIVRFHREYLLIPGVKELRVWEDHVHELVHLGPQLENYASSTTTIIQAIRHKSRDQFGVQFHPEAVGEAEGSIVLESFLRMIRERHGVHQ